MTKSSATRRAFAIASDYAPFAANHVIDGDDILLRPEDPMENTMIVLTTTGTPEDAKSLARKLVEERFAACVNILPIESVYPWDGSIQEDAERLLVIKTTSTRLASLETRLHELHPYDVPEFVAVQTAHVAEAYKAWLTRWIDHGEG